MGIGFREFLEMFYNEPKNKFSLKTNPYQAKYIHAINPSNLAKPVLHPKMGVNKYNPRKAGPASIPTVKNTYFPKTPSVGFKPAV